MAWHTEIQNATETDKSKVSKTLNTWRIKETGLEKCVPCNQVNKYSLSTNQKASYLNRKIDTLNYSAEGKRKKSKREKKRIHNFRYETDF